MYLSQEQDLHEYAEESVSHQLTDTGELLRSAAAVAERRVCYVLQQLQYKFKVLLFSDHFLDNPSSKSLASSW